MVSRECHRSGQSIDMFCFVAGWFWSVNCDYIQHNHENGRGSIWTVRWWKQHHWNQDGETRRMHLLLCFCGDCSNVWLCPLLTPPNTPPSCMRDGMGDVLGMGCGYKGGWVCWRLDLLNNRADEMTDTDTDTDRHRHRHRYTTAAAAAAADTDCNTQTATHTDC